MLKYPHVIESYASVLNIIDFIVLLPINFAISIWTSPTPKLTKYVVLSFVT